MMRQIRLKSGKGLYVPSIFLNPQSELDGEVLRETNEQYPRTPQDAGLEQIDGIAIFLKDWSDVTQGLKLDATSLIPKRSIADRVRLILPELEFLIRGSDADTRKMFQTGIFNSDLRSSIEEVAKSKIGTNTKLDKVVNEIYPKLDTNVVEKLIKFQLDRRADILMTPTVPITSMRQIDRQIEKAKEMIKESHALLESVFTAFHERIDMMNYITVNASTLKPVNYNKLASTLLSYSPDCIGIRVVNLDEANESQVSNMFHAIDAIYQTILEQERAVPIYLFNMDHLGYFAWCYGVSVLTMPIVSDPYFFGRRSEEPPPKKGAYYHPEDKTYDTYEELLRKTRPEYRLPCYCGVCKRFETILRAEASMKWNKFRRVHDVLIRNLELKMLREAPAPLNVALREMFLRSKKLGWIQFIPEKPLIAF